MSLLLEALKRAEKAKEEAQRQQRGDSGAAELRIEEDAPTSAKPVMTRAELPDIRAPLQILSDDISPREAGPAPAPAAAPATAEPQAAQRGAARKVFEAKFRESDPRMPFFITLGVLGAFALGTVGYFWYQLRPPSPLVPEVAHRAKGKCAQHPQRNEKRHARVGFPELRLEHF
ncbi:MAG TPA: hypothetical protein VHG88_13345, partial [Burkholderiales bacterium]|nr:hypothetical protein [Burkholderiales bacterium]